MALTANFDAGTNGNTIAAADPGSVTAWDAVSIAANVTLTYDNAHAHSGTLAAKTVSSGAADIAYMEWSTAFGTQSNHYGRFYIYPSQNFLDDSILIPHNASGDCCYMRLKNATSQVQLFSRTAVLLVTSTNSLTLNAWNRIEFHFIHSLTAGQLEAKLFLGANVDGATPDETITTAANIDSGDPATSLRYGLQSNDTGLTFWLDDILAAGTSYPGSSIAAPSNLPPARPIMAWP